MLHRRSQIAISLAAILITVMVLVFHSQSQSDGDLSNDMYIERASAYFLDGRFEEGILEAKKAIELDPNDPRGYNFLVANYAGLGNYSEAIKTSEKLINMLEAERTFDVNTVMRHAALLEVGSSHDEAIKFLENYREKFPKTVGIHVEGLKKAKEKRTLYYPYFK